MDKNNASLVDVSFHFFFVHLIWAPSWKDELTLGQHLKDQIIPSSQLHLLWGTSTLLARYLVYLLRNLTDCILEHWVSSCS